MSDNEIKAKNSSSSSYREKVLEHLFVGEIMRYSWFSDIKRIEILKPEVDDSGYDLVVEANNILRHIQLKATFQGSKVARFNIHLGLANKPGGCVIVLLPDPQTLKIEKFLWFGGLPGQKLPDISGNAIGKHAKGNSHGTKTQRPMIRVIPRGTFTRVDGVGAIIEKLFGIKCQSPAGLTSLPQVEQPPLVRSGAHRRSSERDYTDKREAYIAAYYLSKFGHQELKLGNQSKTLNLIAKCFAVRHTTLRNARDLFDPHTGSHRVGWRSPAGSVKALSPKYEEIHKKFNEYSEARLRRIVLGFMKGRI
jgi:hypothetical protein